MIRIIGEDFYIKFKFLILRFSYLVTKIIKINIHLMQILKGKWNLPLKKKKFYVGIKNKKIKKFRGHGL
jgi:hypothetical protein